MALRVEQTPFIIEGLTASGHLRTEQAVLIMEGARAFVHAGHMNVQQTMLIVETSTAALATAPPGSFNLQKLILSVRESNVPSRGRH